MPQKKTKLETDPGGYFFRVGGEAQQLPNPQETASLVTFTEEMLIKNFIFCTMFNGEGNHSFGGTRCN